MEVLKQVKLEIQSSDKIVDETMGTAHLEPHEALSELIWNSIDAKECDEQFVKVKIIHHMSPKDKACDKTKLIIVDNGLGMDEKELEKALSLAMTSCPETDKRGRHHGHGLKLAVASLGEKFQIITKRKNEIALRVSSDSRKKYDGKNNMFHFGQLTADQVNLYEGYFLGEDHGTEITIFEPKIKSGSKKAAADIYAKDILPKLGARFRYYLTCNVDYLCATRPRPPIDLPNHKRLNLSIEIKNEDQESSPCIFHETVEAVHPIYYDPETEENKPCIDGKELSGDNHEWKAVIQIGYAPPKHILEEKHPKWKNHKFPYSPSKAGVELMYNGIPIEGNLKDVIGIETRSYNSYMSPLGEIHLLNGFETNQSKSGVIRNEAFKELKEKLSDYLKDKNYYDKAPNKKDKEKRLEDFYSKIIEQVSPETVERQAIIEGTECKIDILQGGDVIWELKAEQAEPIDVAQIVLYIALGDGKYKKHAKLVAKGFSKSTEKAIEMVKKSFGIVIEKTPYDTKILSDYINIG